MLLARIEFDRDRFAAAADAYRKAIEASPKVARDPGVWCEYADALAMAQGGILAGRPRELVERALALDARHARALEMAGSAAFEAGDFAAAARNWRQLLAQMPDGTPAYREPRVGHRRNGSARQCLGLGRRCLCALASLAAERRIECADTGPASARASQSAAHAVDHEADDDDSEQHQPDLPQPVRGGLLGRALQQEFHPDIGQLERVAILEPRAASC